MIRISVCLIALATPLAAQDASPLCTVSSEIVAAAVIQRSGGSGSADAMDAIIETLVDDRAGFRPAVEPIVDWVYTLPEEQLTDEVALAYNEACLAQ